jgi:hypothetical protein
VRFDWEITVGDCTTDLGRMGLVSQCLTVPLEVEYGHPESAGERLTAS